MTLNRFSMPSRALPAAMLRAGRIALAALALAACGEQDEPGDPLGPTGPTGRIRFVNAVSNATAAQRSVNVRVAGVPIAANLAYGAGTGTAAVPYVPALAQQHPIVVSRTADTATKVYTGDVTVVEGQDLTLIAVRHTGGAVELIARGDDANAASATSVKLRVTHAAPSAGGTVDVYVTASTVTDISTIAPTIAGLSFTASSDYLDRAAGNYTIRFTLGGTKTVLATVTTGALANGAVRSVLALDAAAGGTPLTTAVLVDR